MSAPRHELALRILVLGYYFLGQRESDSARTAQHNHIFWLIEHAPESDTAGTPDASIFNRDDPQAYVEAKNYGSTRSAPTLATQTFWATQRNSSCSTISSRAKNFSNKPSALEPDNPEWPERLGQLYSLCSGLDEAAQRASAASALREFQAAECLQSRADPQPPAGGDPEMIEKAKVTKLLMLIDKLPKLAESAFDAGEFEHVPIMRPSCWKKPSAPKCQSSSVMTAMPSITET